MSCQFQVYSTVIQIQIQIDIDIYIYIYLYLYIYIYIQIYIFFRFLSLIGYYKISSIVSCAIKQVLVGYLFYISQCIYVNPNHLIYNPRLYSFIQMIIIPSFIQHLLSTYYFLHVKCCSRCWKIIQSRSLLPWCLNSQVESRLLS